MKTVVKPQLHPNIRKSHLKTSTPPKYSQKSSAFGANLVPIGSVIHPQLTIK